MGYYTDYTLDSYKALTITQSLNTEDVVLNIPDNCDVRDFFGDSELFGVKWYEHIEDIIEVSLLNPNVEFKTSGVGEENGDQWKAVFLNGKYKKVEAKIMFKSFDELGWK